MMTIHDLTLWKYPEVASRLGKLYYRPIFERAVHRAAAIVTPSQAVKQEVEDYFSIDGAKVHAIRLGADSLSRAVESAPTQALPKRYVATLGSVEPRKNLDGLIRGYQRSPLPEAGIKLVVVGRRAWGTLPSGVLQLQGLTDGEVAHVLKRSLGLVVPSLYEGFGLPVAEGIRLGVNVACSDLPVLREVAGDGAFYFNPLDESSIGQALGSLVGHAHPGRPSSTSDEFSWQGAARRLLDLYASIESRFSG